VTTWCLVPARGGSKGLPGKNLREAGGLSLVARAVLAARQFALQAGEAQVRVVVDTDDPAIAAEAVAWGAEVPFLRDAALAGDAVGTVDTVLGFFERLPAGAPDDIVVLLQPTSPLRQADDIALVWHAVAHGGAPSAAAVAPTSERVDLALVQGSTGRLSWLAGDDADGRRRQDAVATLHLTGAAYAIRLGALRRTRRFVASGETIGVPLPEAGAVDVDTAADLALADALLRRTVAPGVMVGDRRIGPGEPCFVIAEAGVNHDGDEALARRLIDAAVEAGADAVKFQTFEPAALVAAAAPTAAYQTANTGATDQRAMLEALTLPRAAWARLAAHAAARGIRFLSTPFDPASADLLAEIGIAAFKVPSGELTNLPFLADLAARGKPMLVSTGMATMAEVAEALLTIRRHGAPPVVLFHCVSAYPAPMQDCNLAAIASLQAAFRLPTGWSDHTPDAAACVAAAALGAVVIEKHLTLDRTMPGPDHAASLEPAEFAALVRDVRAVQAALGDGQKRPMPSESDVRRVARRSLHAARDLAAGEPLAATDLVALRPGTGLTPASLRRMVGRPLARPVASGTMLEEAHLA
jgi:N-acetylneuraminate synthase/N,N'-diacetyllegionaminate synthase